VAKNIINIELTRSATEIEHHLAFNHIIPTTILFSSHCKIKSNVETDLLANVRKIIDNHLRASILKSWLLSEAHNIL
jgi:hypothetical protein